MKLRFKDIKKGDKLVSKNPEDKRTFFVMRRSVKRKKIFTWTSFNRNGNVLEGGAIDLEFNMKQINELLKKKAQD